jgi:hypothetical protein
LCEGLLTWNNLVFFSLDWYTFKALIFLCFLSFNFPVRAHVVLLVELFEQLWEMPYVVYARTLYTHC